MAPGKEMLSFPGEGGYEIKWSPGTMHFRLEQAPSGHLIMPAGEFERLTQHRGGLPAHSTTFHAIPSDTGVSRGTRAGGDASLANWIGPRKPAAAPASGNSGSRIGTGPASAPNPSG